MPPYVIRRKKKKKKKKKTKEEPPHIYKDYGALLGGTLFAIYTLIQWVRCCPKKEGPDKNTGFAPLAHWRMLPWFLFGIITGALSAASRGVLGQRDWHPVLLMFRSLTSGVGLLLVCTQFQFWWRHGTRLVSGYTTLVWIPLTCSLSWVNRYSDSSIYIGDAFGGLGLGYMFIYGALQKRNRDLLYACILMPLSAYLIGKDGFFVLNFFYYLGMMYAQKFLTNAIMLAQGRRPPLYPL